MLRTLNINYVYRIILGCLVVGFFLASLSLSTANLVVTIFMVSLVFVGELVVLYDVTHRLFADDRPDYWILLLGFSFGVGAMCGPFLVAMLGLLTFKVLSLTHLIGLFFMIKFPIPETDNIVETNNGESIQTKVE